MRMKKWITALLLTALLLVVGASYVPSYAAEQTTWEDWIDYWEEAFPSGKTEKGETRYYEYEGRRIPYWTGYYSWNHVKKKDDGTFNYNYSKEVTDTVCLQHGAFNYFYQFWSEGTCNNGYHDRSVPDDNHFKGTQCAGFANRLGYLATGKYPGDAVLVNSFNDMVANTWNRVDVTSTSSLMSTVQVGDILFWEVYPNPGHWTIVTGIDPTRKWVSVLECNIYPYNCIIFRGYRYSEATNSGFGPASPGGQYPKNTLQAGGEWGEGMLPTFANVLANYRSIRILRYNKDKLQPLPYSIVKGDNAEYIKGYSKELAMTSNGDYDSFICALVDGEELDGEHYSVARGSTVLTLKSEYLDTLELGEHTLTFEFTGGSSTGTFEVREEDSGETPSPLTLEVAEKEFAVNGHAEFEVVVKNNTAFPMICWLNVLYEQDLAANDFYNDMFGGDVCQDKSDYASMEDLPSGVGGYAATDRIDLDPGQSRTFTVTAEIPGNWSENSLIVFYIGGWYTPEGHDSQMVQERYIFSKSVGVSGDCGENVTWELDSEGVLTISGSGEMADYVSYTSVPWYSWSDRIESIVIENGVTSIGEWAFGRCSSLESITIPDSVTSIGHYAFYECSNLKSITIPDGVTSIAHSTFSSCSSLESVTIPDNVTSIDDYAFSGCSRLTSITIPDSVTSIGDWAFHSCSSLVSITIPDGVTSIGERAFWYCSGLESIEIPDSVTSIGEYAFYHCISLESITIPAGVTSIGDAMFYECSSLKSVTLPDSMTSIGYWAFLECSSLESITIPESVTSIGSYAFYNCSSLTRIELPDNITSIGSTVFDGCSAEVVCNANTQTAATLANAGYTFTPAGPTVVASGSCGANVTWQLNSEGLLTISGSGAMTDYSYDAPWYSRRESINAVVIEEGVTSIGDYAFDDCSDLTSITIPDGVTSIGNAAFDCCVNLASISIPDSVTSIGAYAFNGCVSLESIVIPEGVTSIGEGTFYGCSSLVSVTIPDGVTSIGNEAFSYCYTLEGITLPDSVTSIGNSAFYGCNSLVSVTIPDGVTSIGSAAFAACSNMKQITIPASVTSISLSAFAGCRGLESITIPESVTSIGNSAFRNCSSLTRIELPDNITSIGNNVFTGCSAEVVCNANSQTATTLTNAGYTFTPVGPSVVASGSCGTNVTWQLNSEGLLTISGSGAMENYSDGDAPWYSRRESVCAVVIEDGVTSIGDWAFSDCSGLASITIPDSVTSIGMDAFAGCSSLESIVIPEGVTSIGVSAFAGCSSLESITIPDGVTSISPITFADCSSLESITIPESVTSIGARAFMNCSGLKGITIPEGVTSIEGYVFSGCSSLESITIPESVTSIGGRAFMNCSSLESITIPESVTSISAGAFMNCTSLTSIELPDNIVSIGSNVFDGCSAEVVCRANSQTAATLANAGYTFTSVVPVVASGSCGDNVTWQLDGEGLLTISGSGAMADYILDSNVPWYSRRESIGAVVIEDGVTSIGEKAFYECSSLESIVIPDSVTSIGDNAFCYCSSLASITIPAGVTSIGWSVFNGCSSLESVTLPEGLTSIGSGVFRDCDSLKSITIPDSVTSIGNSAFSGCSSLESVTIPQGVTSIGSYTFYQCTNLKSITLPEGMTSIGGCAFAYCSSLESIMLPDSVTSIDYSVFLGCSSLKSITLPDSLTSIGEHVFWGCYSLTSITIPEGVTSIGDSAFYTSGVTSIAILNAGDMTFGDDVFTNSVTVYCYKYSAADFWAEENEYPVIYLDGLEENQPQTITLPEDFSLRKGESCTIAAEIFPDIPNVQISWSSSAPEIAAVENGCVTALAAGEAIITAACGDVSDTVRVTVNVPLESFDLPADEFWMISKETMQLNIQNVQPEDGTEPVIWSSSNTSVLTVSQSGLLTGKMPGDAVVTATAPNGFSRSATVHVCYPVTAVAFEQESHDVVIGGQIQLSANVTARTQSFVNKLVTFASSDETIAAVDENGLVTAMGYGTAEITAAASSGVQAACTVRVVCGAHQETVTPAVEPTCAETGLTEGRHCSVCGAVLVEQEVVAKVGHRIAFEQAVYETELGAQTGEALLVAQCGHDVAIRAQVSGEAELVSADNLRVQYRGKACGVAEITVQTDDAFATSAVCRVIVHAKDKMELPEALRIIGEEAFMGMPAKEIVLGDHVETIGSKAFAGCANLRLISLPDTVASIAADAFSGCENLTIICGEGSAAQRFAQDHGMAYVTR